MAGSTRSSVRYTRITTLRSLSMSPKLPRSTRSEKPVTMRPSWARSGSAAWPTRGMMKKSPPASAKVIAAATRLTRVSGPRKKTRRVEEPAAPSRPACSSSVTTWLRISIHVPSTRKTTNTARKLRLKLMEAAATSMKNDSSAASRRSRRPRRTKSRRRMRNSSRCTIPSSSEYAR